MENNLKILSRLLELAKNRFEFSTHPRGFREEYMFLSNILTDSVRTMELEFNRTFQEAVSEYRRRLETDGYGWFHNPEKLVWERTYINQVLYAVYGDGYVSEIKFNYDLGKEAYKDLIEQIDRTVLMSEEEVEAHNEAIERISREIADELLAEKERKKG